MLYADYGYTCPPKECGLYGKHTQPSTLNFKRTLTTVFQPQTVEEIADVNLELGDYEFKSKVRPKVSLKIRYVITSAEHELLRINVKVKVHKGVMLMVRFFA